VPYEVILPYAKREGGNELIGMPQAVFPGHQAARLRHREHPVPPATPSKNPAGLQPTSHLVGDIPARSSGLLGLVPV